MTKEQEKEFDERFPADDNALIQSGTSYAIKAFISKVEKEAEERGYWKGYDKGIEDENFANSLSNQYGKE